MPTIADATAIFMPTVSEIIWIPTPLADTVGLQPTTAEAAAGLRLMNELYDVEGFSGSTSWITRKKGGTRVRTQMAGAYTYGSAAIIMTADRAGNDAGAEFAVDPDSDIALEGHLLCAWRGLTANRPAKMFKVEVAPTEELKDFDNDYMRLRIPFGIQKVKDILVPAGL